MVAMTNMGRRPVFAKVMNLARGGSPFSKLLHHVSVVKNSMM